MSTFPILGEVLTLDTLPWFVPPSSWSGEGDKKVVEALRTTVLQPGHGPMVQSYGRDGSGLSQAAKPLISRLLYGRLVDIRAWIPREQNNEMVKSRGSGRNYSEELSAKKTVRWPETLRKMLKRLEQPQCNIPPDGPKDTIHATYLRLYHRLKNRKEETSIINCEIAALHIAWLNNGHEDIQSMEELDKWVNKAVETGEDEMGIEGLMKGYGVDGLNNFRQPLQIAAFLSPIALLLDVNMGGKAVAKERILRAWWHFGGSRPNILTQVEKRIWKALFEMADGKDSLDCLRRALTEIEPLLTNVPDSDRTWLSLPVEDQITITRQHSGAIEDRNVITISPPQIIPVGVDDGEHGDNSGQGNEMDVDDQQEGRPARSTRTKRTLSVSGLGDSSKSAPERKKHTGSVSKAAAGRKIVKPKTRIPTPRTDDCEEEDQRIWRQTREPVNQGVYPVAVDMNQVEEGKDPSVKQLNGISANRLTSKSAYKVWSVDGECVEYRPMAHHPEDLTWQEALLAAAEACYIEEAVDNSTETVKKPLFLLKANESQFAILTQEDAQRLTVRRGQELFGRQHIIVKGTARGVVEFDSVGLSEVGYLNEPRQIHDLSSKKRDGRKAIRIATFNDMLKSNSHESGKILNALSIPLSQSPPLEKALDTHGRALHLARSEPFMGLQKENPTEGTAWSLVATKGAFHRWHIDTDGFATYLEVVTGLKIWIVARPVNPHADSYGLNKLSVGVVDPKVVVPEGYIVEAVLLREGDALRMQPCTPHAVITPKPAICKGGHFYASSTIRRTCYGIFHCFAAGGFITNTEHTNTSRRSIQRIITVYHTIFTQYYLDKQDHIPLDIGHTPDITQWEGMLDVLMVINLVELIYITHHRAYTKEGFMALERDQMIIARKFARELREWIWRHYTLKDTTGKQANAQEVYWDFLARQCRGLISLKSSAMNNGIRGESAFTSQHVKTKILESFEGNDCFTKAWKALETEDIETLAYPVVYTVHRRQDDDDTDMTETDAEETGMTAIDATWRNAGV
ncbi:hypothetical protein BDN72DRAFT_966149 [Pluteus cervinus]|uniref:Uncharacterized protein n=1 Tax=Pluteus cervinus TaxID=181527 RepID=A0ACD3A0H9_9AGAR|nr:hypothetical protein BDN72DRAFT_966149 [Pluteus cervinus]